MRQTITSKMNQSRILLVSSANEKIKNEESAMSPLLFLPTMGGGYRNMDIDLAHLALL